MNQTQQEILSISKEIYLDTIKEISLETISNMAKIDPDGLEEALTGAAALSIVAASTFLETFKKACLKAQND
jgi:hypothetical protein